MLTVFPGTSEIHAQTFANALGAEVSRDFRPDAEAVLFVGVSPHLTPISNQYREAGKKLIGYWIGSDSLCALQDARYRAHVPVMDQHLTVHDRITKELKAWKVESDVVYPCPRGVFETEPFPAEPKVGIYMPGAEPLYMFFECMEVARSLPEMKFLLFGATTYPELPPNVEIFGRHDPNESKTVFSEVTCILRLCQHDGFPVGGIEARMRGRKVIENYPYPGFTSVETMDDVVEALKNPETHKDDPLDPWPAWYRLECSPRRFKENVCQTARLELPM